MQGNDHGRFGRVAMAGVLALAALPAVQAQEPPAKYYGAGHI